MVFEVRHPLNPPSSSANHTSDLYDEHGAPRPSPSTRSTRVILPDEGDIGFDEIHPSVYHCPQELAQEATQAPNKARTDKFIPYRESYDTEFLNWWYHHEWYGTTNINVVWSKKKSKKRADAWGYFNQVARKRDGMPFVQCLLCQKVLTHPNVKNTGTNPLQRHIRSQDCVRRQDGTESLKRLFSKRKVR
jgi:hypothetical protein